MDHNQNEGIIMKEYGPGLHAYWKHLVVWVALGLVLAPATGFSDTNLLYGVHKGRLYVQTNDDAPVLAQNNAWSFGGEVDPKNSGLVTDAAVVSPLGNSEVLNWNGFMEMFGTNTYFSTQANLDSAYPAGQYFIDVRGGVNQRSPITLPPG
jgi:hypothetical protein